MAENIRIVPMHFRKFGHIHVVTVKLFYFIYFANDTTKTDSR